MKILVTGGAGFIGSHLVEALMARGDHVTVLDDYSTGKWPFGSKIVKGGILDSVLVGEIMDECDQVYHLAAVVGVSNVYTDPLKTLDTNILGTDSVLKNAAIRAKKVLFASSSEVYGDSGCQECIEWATSRVHPVTENYRSVYGLSKLAGEHIAFALHAQLGLQVVVARLFNTIGPRQLSKYGMVVPGFVSQALSGETITVYGEGDQKRTFIDVRDMVSALMALMDTQTAVGEVFNVGGTRRISILDLANMVRKIAGSSSPVQIVDFPYGDRFGDNHRGSPNTDKIKKFIEFQPKITLEESIRDVVAFFRNQPISHPALERVQLSSN